MAIDPDSVECDRHERLYYRFEDEARHIALALNKRPGVQAYSEVADVLDGIATVRFTLTVDVQATLGEVEDRLEYAMNEAMQAMPENARKERQRIERNGKP